MPPNKELQGHQWTKFELHTMFCLIVKGAHIEGRSKRSDAPGTAQRAAYLTFVTQFNSALHKHNFEEDISKSEVIEMLQRMLRERKAVVGPGGLAERQRGGRVTRSLKLAWESGRKMDFNGSIIEWNMWRCKKENQKRRARLGLPPQESPGVAEASDHVGSFLTAGSPGMGRSADGAESRDPVFVSQPGADSSRANPHSSTYAQEFAQGNFPTTANSSIDNANLDSFNRLPSSLLTLERFKWANPLRNHYRGGEDYYSGQARRAEQNQPRKQAPFHPPEA